MLSDPTNTTEVAQALGISKTTVRHAVRSRRCAPVGRLGPARLYRARDVLRALKAVAGHPRVAFGPDVEERIREELNRMDSAATIQVHPEGLADPDLRALRKVFGAAAKRSPVLLTWFVEWHGDEMNRRHRVEHEGLPPAYDPELEAEMRESVNGAEQADRLFGAGFVEPVLPKLPCNRWRGPDLADALDAVVLVREYALRQGLSPAAARFVQLVHWAIAIEASTRLRHTR